MHPHIRTLIACALGAWLLVAPAFAQIPSGTILGNVKDAQGAVVPGATVTATNTGTQFSRSTVTDAEGQYTLPLLIDDCLQQLQMPKDALSANTRAMFAGYTWPGNVRELKNAISRAVSLGVGLEPEPSPSAPDPPAAGARGWSRSSRAGWSCSAPCATGPRGGGTDPGSRFPWR